MFVSTTAKDVVAPHLQQALHEKFLIERDVDPIVENFYGLSHWKVIT